jgi:hypothetical protein
MLRRKSLSILGACLALVLAGCSGGDPVFQDGTSAPDPSAGDSGAPGPTEDPGLEPEGDDDVDFDPFDFGLNYEFAEEPLRLTSDLGGADPAAAAALHSELEAGGVDLTGMELWVFDVNGSDDRLLVMDVNRGVEQVPEDSDSADLLEVLIGSPAFDESGITRFVLNFFGTDTEGGFVLTTTMDIDALVTASAGEEDLDADALADLAQIEIFRVDALPPGVGSDTTEGTTTTQAPATTASSAVLVDTFDGTSSVSPLFPPGVMSTEVTPEGTLSMSAFTTGVIPAIYPNPIPGDVSIAFDFNPMPNNSTAAFGALVLAEDPSDSALDHYVAIWANPSDGLLTVIPFDLGNGGWGAPTTEPIPATVGFAADTWHRMGLTLSGGTVEVYLDSILITTWSGTTPVTSGHWGPVIIGAVDGDAMLVDNVLVEMNG